MRSGRTEQVRGQVPFRAQSASTSSQSAQGVEGPAELTHTKVDQGPDGRTRPGVIRGDPEISALLEGAATPPTMRGARLPPPIPWSGLSRPGRRGYSSDVLLYSIRSYLQDYLSATPVAACKATVPRTRQTQSWWTPVGHRG